ncbi:hypothetical protein Hamer_G030732, partial [Homarus americanus]
MIGSGPCQGEVCTLLYHTSCLTCTAVPGFSPPISGWQKCSEHWSALLPKTVLTGYCLGLPCACLLAAALDGSALCLLAGCCPGRLCSVLACLLAGCCPGRLCSVCAAVLDGSALCAAAAALDGSACAAALDGSA